jgi:hypothetical protein
MVPPKDQVRYFGAGLHFRATSLRLEHLGRFGASMGSPIRASPINRFFQPVAVLSYFKMLHTLPTGGLRVQTRRRYRRDGV